MVKIIKLGKYKLVDLNEDIVKELFSWEYEEPYNIYNLHLNEYLLNKNTWGNEQFVIMKKI